jgi:hypothetical protein
MITVLGLVIKLNPLYIDFYDISTELYGVSTMFISVRVGLGWATGESAVDASRMSTWKAATLPPPG